MTKKDSLSTSLIASSLGVDEQHVVIVDAGVSISEITVSDNVAVKQRDKVYCTRKFYETLKSMK
ncbi:hypothetical protein RCDURKIN_13 [Rhodobacter phage RcDurkin]|nr:hypothetical protein RCDURKIN_13 [Rhodobacter phage RcDurkin]QXN72483.1 hypothetical protein RCTIPTONUS_13 [Rhodobacter phage RcTiptonus]UUV43757.1 hypothetical protein RCKICKAPOO_16 [Rhodobacter phage RcKickapoo]UUV44384.1 hypothetical protein RCMENCHIE_15 [Rhodobacter phage RcMenchie]